MSESISLEFGSGKEGGRVMDICNIASDSADKSSYSDSEEQGDRTEQGKKPVMNLNELTWF